MASKQEITDWFNNGVENNFDYLLVVLDTFNYEDYPVYCHENDYRTKHEDYSSKNMQTVMEMYILSDELEIQFALNKLARSSK